MATYEQAIAWRLKNPERYLEHQARYRAKNKERRNFQSREWNKSNPVKVRKACSEWSKRNRDQCNARYHKRRAILKLVTFEDCRKKISLLSREKFCRWCCTPLSDSNRTIDHIIPLARGGNHIPDNLAASCARCNSSRKDKLVEEWLPSQTFT